MTAALGLPAQCPNPWLPRAAVIDKLAQEAPNVCTYRLRWAADPGPADYTFSAGQFNMLYVPGCGEAAISMSGPPTQASHWVHTIRRAGQVTSALAHLAVGDQIGVRGPYGRPWPLDQCAGRDVVLIAGGIGLAPLRPAIYEVLSRRSHFGRLVLLYGARTAQDLLYRREFAAWQVAGLAVETTVDRSTADWTGHVGVVPLLVQRLRLARPRDTMVLCCGPEVMMRYSALAAMERGVPASQVYVSLERHMQCAVGLCGHCQLGTTLICRDGPVFSWDRASPLLSIHDL
jgi:NAD(P)H-flavin reductase